MLERDGTGNKGYRENVWEKEQVTMPMRKELQSQKCLQGPFLP